MRKYFLTTYRLTKGKIHRKVCILQKRDLYQNQFSNKKGAIAKPESPKKHPIWAAHPRTHLSTKYPPPPRGVSHNIEEKSLSSVSELCKNKTFGAPA